MSGLDLNLLASLDILIEEENVTHAAARLGISQPALSAQLSRLRDLFGDPLLVPSETGRGMLATTRALEMHAPLHAALKDLESVVRLPASFDPLVDSRTFAIGASDNAIVTLGLALIERLRMIASQGIRVSFSTPRSDQVAGKLERGEIDLLIGSDRMIPPAIKARKLLSETYVMVQRKGHPRGHTPLDLDAYCALEHVLMSTSGGSFYGFIDEQLEKLGCRRDVALSVQQFVMVPMIVETTNFVSTLPRRFAARFVDRLDIFELPFDAQGFNLFSAWHPRQHADPGHVWLRRMLADVADASLDEPELEVDPPAETVWRLG